MDIKGAIARMGSALLHVFSPHRWDILQDIMHMAVPFVEHQWDMDLDGDGRVATNAEIVEAAKKFGGDFKSYLLNDDGSIKQDVIDNMPEGRYKKWLAMSRVVNELWKMGKKLPSLGRLETGVQLGYEIVDELRSKKDR